MLPADGARREGCWFNVRKWDRVSFRKLEGAAGGGGEAECRVGEGTQSALGRAAALAAECGVWKHSVSSSPT